MKTITAILACVLLMAGVALAASIDRKWVAERKIGRDGNTMTIIQTFDLKSEGNKLTGNLTMAFGDKFSFAAVMETPNGDMKVNYEGTVEGDTLKGTSMREGGQGRPFEAKRK